MIRVTVNAPTGQVAMQIVAQQIARDGRHGYRVTGFEEAPEQLPNDKVALFVAMPPASTFVVLVQKPVTK